MTAASRFAIAIGVFLASLCAYLANDDLLPMSDATPNAYLPASLIADGDLVFSPFEAPSLFLWEIDAPSGKTRIV
jgi:hypothetical protein